jgi:glutathione peroxidase-family protein
MGKNTKLAGQPIICQLLSFLPKSIVDTAVSMHESDKHYHTMTTYKQMVFMLYGVISKCVSLTSLCKNLLFLEDKLTYLGIDKLPAKSQQFRVKGTNIIHVDYLT